MKVKSYVLKDADFIKYCVLAIALARTAFVANIFVGIFGELF